MSTPGWKVSSLPLKQSGGQSLIPQTELEQLGQSGSEAQLWVCLVVKIRSDAVKNNNA